MEDYDPPIIGGVNAIGLPYELNDEEAEEAVRELREALARKRPPGFAPWPDDNKQEGNK